MEANFSPSLFASEIEEEFESYILDLNREVIKVEVLSVYEENELLDDCVSRVVWPASISAILYFCQQRFLNYFHNKKKVLELGSGTGIFSLFLSNIYKESKFIATDCCSKSLNVMKKSVQKNIFLNLNVEKLSWGEGKKIQEFKEKVGRFDVIVGTDVCYDPILVKPLLETASEILNENGVLYLFNHRHRFDPLEKTFINAVNLSGLTFEIISLTVSEQTECENIFLKKEGNIINVNFDDIRIHKIIKKVTNSKD